MNEDYIIEKYINNINDDMYMYKNIYHEYCSNPCDEIELDPMPNKNLVIDMDSLYEKFKAVKAQEKADKEAMKRKMEAEVEARKLAADCFAPEVFKPFVSMLFSKLSEDDCRALCVLLFDALSKDNKQITLSPSIETAILTFMINNQ